MRTSLILLLFTLFFATSCSKYEEGPFVSLKSRDSRVANVWKVSSAKDLNGKDSTANYNLKKWELTDKYSVIYHIDQDKFFGRWQFTNNNNNIEMVFDSLGTVTYEIKKLKEKEMILKNRKSEITIEFIPVN